MASLGRRQETMKQESIDIGQKIWEEAFKDVDINTLINTKLHDLNFQEASDSKLNEEKKKAFATAIGFIKNFGEKELQFKYTETLNKLIRLRSRTAIVSFLYLMDPLPKEIIQSFESLEKLLLISFNEAVNI